MLYYYGNTGPDGNTLDSNITENLNALFSLISMLDGYGYKLIAFNNEGIIVDYKIYITKDDLDRKIIETQNDIIDLRAKVETNESMLNSHYSHIHTLYKNIDDLKKDDIDGQQVTEEFFVFAEMLPEHIRKELKIYIKKT
jgi:hypothetical protein